MVLTPPESQSSQEGDDIPGRGNLLGLPKELRRLVLQQLSPEDRSAHLVYGLIREEMRSVVRDNRLRFSLLPQWEASTGSQIRITDQHKANGSLYPACHSFESREQHTVDQFLRFPYHEIRDVTFNIQAPGREAEDLLRCWNSLTWLIEFWSRVAHKAQHLNVMFSETNGRGWTTDGKLNDKLFLSLDDSCRRIKTDIRIMLQPLWRIRHTTLTILLPPSMASSLFSGFRDLSATIVEKAEHAEAFGENGALRQEYYRIVSEELAFSAWFDTLLDKLPDKSSAMLRLETLAWWGAGYRANHKNACDTASTLVLRRLGSATFGNPSEELLARFELRKRTAVAFNPGNWRRHNHEPRSVKEWCQTAASVPRTDLRAHQMRHDGKDE